ncbi:MAG: cation diffusion facilitator family transporter, partial [Chloroflexota bacterium]
MDAQRTAHLKDKQPPASEGHVHSHGVSANMGGKLVAALVLTSLFVVGEFTAGLISNSLALISDAGHNLTDALAVSFSLWALSLAKKGPTPDKTFGYYRAGILAAALNAGTLVLIALFIFYEGVGRLLHPEPVQGGIIIVVAAVAVVLNGAIAFMLSAGSDDLNVRSTFIHMAGDALSAVGVILAGIGILLTGWQFLDPIVSFLIGIFILWSSWGIVKEAVNILMEGTPAGLNVGQLIADMDSVQGVNTVHDVHVWTIGHDRRALSAHVNTGNCTVLQASQCFARLNEMLETKYDIVHSTLQAECAECDANDEYCSFGADGSGSKAQGHDHDRESVAISKSNR